MVSNFLCLSKKSNVALNIVSTLVVEFPMTTRHVFFKRETASNYKYSASPKTLIGENILAEIMGRCMASA